VAAGSPTIVDRPVLASGSSRLGLLSFTMVVSSRVSADQVAATRPVVP
jgi:hypothetical protein